VTDRPLANRVYGIVMLVIAGFGAVKSPRRGLWILAISALLWVLQASYYVVCLWALHLPVTWAQGALLTGLLALTAIIPTGPGFAGSFEVMTAAVLAGFGVAKEPAIAALQYSRITTILGVVLLTGLSFLLLRVVTKLRPAPALADGSLTAAGSPTRLNP
jgi:uncharacterized membrane protein YbhN (UPF0104 family)